MPGLAEFRAQHPDYDDMGDLELADALHDKFYRDIPRDKFDAQLGIKTSQGLGFMEGVKTVFDKIPSTPLDFIPGLDSRPSRDKASAGAEAYLKGRENAGERPGGFGKAAGGIAASAPLAFVGGPMTSGALQGYAASESPTLAGRAMDAGAGAIGGKVASVALNKLGNALKPAAAAAMTRMSQAGVKLTPGQVRGGKALIREDKKMSLPGIGEDIHADRLANRDSWNIASVNEYLKPLKIAVPEGVQAGHDAVAFAHDAVSAAYERIIPQLAVKINPRQFVAKIAPEAKGLGEVEKKRLTDIISETLGNGELEGQALKTAQGEVRRLASSFVASADGYQRELGRVLGAVDRHLSGEMLKQNPTAAPVLQRVNRAFRGLAIIESAAKGADDGVFSTQQLKTAARQSDPSRRKSATATGRAFGQDWVSDSRRAMPGAFPNSGTADRINAGSMMRQVQGQVGRMGYAADKAVTNALLQAPPQVRAFGNALQRYADPFGRLTGAAVANRPK